MPDKVYCRGCTLNDYYRQKNILNSSNRNDHLFADIASLLKYKGHLIWKLILLIYIIFQMLPFEVHFQPIRIINITISARRGERNT